MTDYSALAYSLPENVMMYKYSGRTEDELRQIDFWLSRDIPDAMRSALLLERETAVRIADEYCLTFDEALGVISSRAPLVELVLGRKAGETVMIPDPDFDGEFLSATVVSVGPLPAEVVAWANG